MAHLKNIYAIGSITVWLTSCLSCLVSAALLMLNKQHECSLVCAFHPAALDSNPKGFWGFILSEQNGVSERSELTPC